MNHFSQINRPTRWDQPLRAGVQPKVSDVELDGIIRQAKSLVAQGINNGLLKAGIVQAACADGRGRPAVSATSGTVEQQRARKGMAKLRAKRRGYPDLEAYLEEKKRLRADTSRPATP